MLFLEKHHIIRDEGRGTTEVPNALKKRRDVLAGAGDEAFIPE
jgi:hypothetical protein